MNQLFALFFSSLFSDISSSLDVVSLKALLSFQVDSLKFIHKVFVSILYRVIPCDE